jgi:hypothetical protein
MIFLLPVRMTLKPKQLFQYWKACRKTIYRNKSKHSFEILYPEIWQNQTCRDTVLLRELLRDPIIAQARVTKDASTLYTSTLVKVTGPFMKEILT